MSEILFQCPHCQRVVAAAAALAGSTTVCPNYDCGRFLVVPEDSTLSPDMLADLAVPDPTTGRVANLPGHGPRTSRQAIASLVLAMLALVAIGLGPFFGILALVFGRRAKVAIARSGGTLGGRGMATLGMVFGIINSLLSFVLLIIVLMIYSYVYDPFGLRYVFKPYDVICQNNLRQISISLVFYAEGHDGYMPDGYLDEMRYDASVLEVRGDFPANYLHCETSREARDAHNAGNSEGEPADPDFQTYHYVAAGLNFDDITDLANQPLVYCHHISRSGKSLYYVVFADSSVRIFPAKDFDSLVDEHAWKIYTAEHPAPHHPAVPSADAEVPGSPDSPPTPPLPSGVHAPVNLDGFENL